ncbi:adenylyl-sulfate kinase [Paraburkholderia flagellata]|uniref:adenylyl-sulfate kinase n=1 Tax=Paraburkholderia flagellata TaxID=2883241 RepID=UPI003571405B
METLLRTGLYSDLGFSDGERTENLRRVAHVSAPLCKQGFVVVTTATPLDPEHRANVRRIGGGK